MAQSVNKNWFEGPTSQAYRSGYLVRPDEVLAWQTEEVYVDQNQSQNNH
jgi:hypothetical protein